MNNMFNRVIAGVAVTAMVFSFVVVPASAQTVTSTQVSPTATRQQQREAKMQEKKAEREVKAEERKADSIERLKEKANKEIERRLKVLNHLLELIEKANKLSAEQKSSLSAQVQAEITALNALKEKIDADTDLATLRADVASIKKSYRIFALFVPKIHILVKAERTLDLADKTSTLAAKLEQRINALPEGSSNSAELQTLLTTMKKQIEDARSQAKLAITSVALLTPEGYPGNRTSLMNARKLLRDAHRNLMLAHKTGKKIIKLLRENDVTGTPTTTVTVVPTAVPTEEPTAVPTQ